MNNTVIADMTLDQAMALADQQCPLPALAGQALRVMRDRIRDLDARLAEIPVLRGSRVQGGVTDEDVRTASRVYHEKTSLVHHSEDPDKAEHNCMRAALEAVWPVQERHGTLSNGAPPVGASIRCRKCGEMTEISFNYGHAIEGCCNQYPCARPGIGPCDRPARREQAQQGEAVAWQHRFKGYPDDWKECTREEFEYTQKHPDCPYEARELYTHVESVQQVEAVDSDKVWTLIATLNAMASNYGQGHLWDALDGDACRRAASVLTEFVRGSSPRRTSVPDIKEAVNRFLCWSLPDDFRPDAGIVFTAPRHPNGWPVGTNLLTAKQAETMLRHVLDIPQPEGGES